MKHPTDPYDEPILPRQPTWNELFDSLRLPPPPRTGGLKVPEGRRALMDLSELEKRISKIEQYLGEPYQRWLEHNRTD